MRGQIQNYFVFALVFCQKNTKNGYNFVTCLKGYWLKFLKKFQKYVQNALKNQVKTADDYIEGLTKKLQSVTMSKRE